MPAVPDYLNPDLPDGLRRVRMPVVEATNAALEGYGALVEDPKTCDDERSSAGARKGWRPVDADTGDEGGTTEGIFVSEWRGDILYGRNEAVGGHYILAYAGGTFARRRYAPARTRRHAAMARQLPPGRRPALLPARSESRFSFRSRCPATTFNRKSSSASASTARHGLYIHPDIWHEGVFTCAGAQRFFDQQGAAHARLGGFRAREFGCLLEAPLR